VLGGWHFLIVDKERSNLSERSSPGMLRRLNDERGFIMKRNGLAGMVGMSALASCIWVLLGNRVADTPKKETPPEPSEGFIHRSDLTYDSVNGKPLMLDVVSPESGRGPFPVVIVLHGVGPTNKGRQGCLPWAKELARKGYAGVAVSYRCKPEDAFPAPIQDIRSAIHWLHVHADQFKIDKNRIGVVGFSGGGALACLLGTAGDPRDRLAGVQAVVSFYGPTDFARLHEGCLAKTKTKECPTLEKWQSTLLVQTLEKWFGGPPSKVPERYALASPMSQVVNDSSPILLIHGAADTVVPVEQSQLFANKLQKAGRPVSLLVVEGGGHDFEEKNKTNGRLAFAAVVAFLDDHLLAVRSGTKTLLSSRKSPRIAFQARQ
jgi:acetyl esterase/lipase